MNEITVDPKSLAENKGLNKYTLLQSQSDDVTQQYKEVLGNVEGSLTTVSDNDAQSKIKVAITTLNSTNNQTSALIKFQESFRSIENQIDPERLTFEIDKGTDGEICIYRSSDNGISNIIINDDGTLAYSFIAYKNSNKNDIYCFYENGDELDCELIVLKFFSL